MENQIIHEFKEYIHMTSEIGALYHDAAVKANLSDSVMNILYTVMTFGSECTQSNICHLTGISRQTINSAIRKLEQEEILYLEEISRKTKIIRLTQKGQLLAEEKVLPILRCEEAVFRSWSEEERNILLTLTRKYYLDFKSNLEER